MTEGDSGVEAAAIDMRDSITLRAMSEPLIRIIAMPADANPAGDIFGGWVMSLMDLAAGSAATKRARGRCSTVAVDAMQFHRPVLVGDEVSLYAEVTHVGRTSMKVQVRAVRRARAEVSVEEVTTGCFTFVAIDEDRKPRVVPAEEAA